MRGQTANLMLEMVRMLVDEPNAVLVQTEAVEGGFLVNLHVAPGDVGKVIGKHGRTANAIRTILSATGKRQQTRYDLNIVAKAGFHGTDENGGTAFAGRPGLPKPGGRAAARPA